MQVHASTRIHCKFYWVFPSEKISQKASNPWISTLFSNLILCKFMFTLSIFFIIWNVTHIEEYSFLFSRVVSMLPKWERITLQRRVAKKRKFYLFFLWDVSFVFLYVCMCVNVQATIVLKNSSHHSFACFFLLQRKKKSFECERKRVKEKALSSWHIRVKEEEKIGIVMKHIYLSYEHFNCKSEGSLWDREREKQ
jgi:hypothetical protein